MAGGHLNREIVWTLRRLVPSYPVGGWIEVVAGRFRGWRGVVTAVHQVDVDRPVVRLHLDGAGEEVASPIEVDTRTEPEMGLACVPSPVPAAVPTSAGSGPGYG